MKKETKKQLDQVADDTISEISDMLSDQHGEYPELFPYGAKGDANHRYMVKQIARNLNPQHNWRCDMGKKLTLEEKQEMICEEQTKEGIKRYGKKRWDKANYGWYCESDTDITTKVYGEPCMLLNSSIKKGRVVHVESVY